MMNVFRGLLIGLANLVPGVSGATIAVVLGVYERLIDAIANLVKFRFNREQLTFVAAIGIGIVVAIIAGSAGMEYLLEGFPALAYSVFFGLVLGSIPMLFRQISSFKLFHFLIGVSSIVVFEIVARSIKLSGAYLLLSGIFAACAMVLPGLSGSLVMLIFNVYDDVIDALANFKIDVVFVFGIGVVIGIAIMALVMDWLVQKYPNQTKSFTFGLVIASLIKIEPFTKDQLDLVKVILIFLIIACSGYASLKLSHRQTTQG